MRHELPQANAERVVMLDVTDLVPIDPLQFLRYALAAILVIVAMCLLVMATIDPDHDRFIFRSIFAVFWMDAERNVPTFASFLLIGFGALLLAIRARLAFMRHERLRKHWAVLAALFVALAFDEAAQMHELVIGPIRYLVALDGVLYFAWIIPALLLLLILAMAYMPFLLMLPRATAFTLVACGAVYVGGAVGGEMVGGLLASRAGFADTGYQFVTIMEETGELVGLALFCATMLAVLRGRLRS